MPITSSKQNLVALSAGTHTWVPTPESEAVQDEVISVMRKHSIARLDTARAYVRFPFLSETVPTVISLRCPPSVAREETG
jgi:hypothetical protein